MTDKNLKQTLEIITKADPSGINQTGKDLQGLSDKADQHGSHIGGVLKGIGVAAAAGGLAVGAGLALAVDKASQFDDALLKTQALAGASKDEMEGYRKGILDLTTQIPVSAKEMADALFFVKSAGFQGADALNILKIAGEASAAGLGAVPVVVDAVTSALNAYHMSGQDAAKITDILTTAVTDGKASADTFAPALGRILPLAASMGVGLDQVAASMATMTRVGLSTDEAATALRGTLASLEKPGKQAQEALASIGLTADDLKASIRDKGLLSTLQDLMDRTDGNVDTLDHIIPNIRALTGVLATAGTQGDTYNQILQDMQKANGNTEKAFATMQQSASFQMGLLKNNVNKILIEVGSAILPSLVPVLSGITKVLPEVFGGISTAIEQVRPTIQRAFGVLFGSVGNLWDWFFGNQTANGPAAGGPSANLSRVMTFVNLNVLPGLMAGKKLVQGAVGDISSWLFGEEVGAFGVTFDSRFQLFVQVLQDSVVPALGAVATFVTTKLVPALALVAWDYYGTLIKALATVVETTLIPALQQIGTFVVQTVLPSLDKLGNWLTSTAIPALDRFGVYISEALNNGLRQLGTLVVTTILPALLKLSDWVLTVAVPALAQLIGQVVEHVMPTLDRWVKQITNEILPSFTAFVTALMDDVTRLVAWINEHWNQIYPIIKPVLDILIVIVRTAWNDIANVIQTSLNVIRDVLNTVTALLKGDWEGAWNGVKQIALDLWTAITSLATNHWNEIRDAILKPIGEVVSGLGDKAGGLLGDVWKNVTDTFQGLWDWLDKKWSAATDAIMAPFRWVRDHAGSELGTLAGILFAPEKLVYNGMDSFVHAVGSAVNWVLGKLGLSQWSVDFRLPALPFGLAKGTNNWQGGVAWVGEQGPELAMLPAGAAVLPNSQSMALVQQGLVSHPSMARTPGFQFGLDPGKILGSITSALGDAASGIGSFISEWTSKGAEALLNAAFDQFHVGDAARFSGVFSDLGVGVLNTVKDAVLSNIKELLGIAAKAIPSVPSGGLANSNEITSWIRAAMKATGIGDESWLPALLWMVAHESSPPGNVYSHGKDPADPAGSPASDPVGLMQVKEYNFPAGMSEAQMMDPVTNISAGLRRIASAWKSPFNIPGVLGSGNYLGYAAGGIISEPVIGVGVVSGRSYAFGEQGDEAVIPLSEGYGTSGAGLNVVVANGSSPAVSEFHSATTALASSAGSFGSASELVSNAGDQLVTASSNLSTAAASLQTATMSVRGGTVGPPYHIPPDQLQYYGMDSSKNPHYVRDTSGLLVLSTADWPPTSYVRDTSGLLVPASGGGGGTSSGSSGAGKNSGGAPTAFSLVRDASGLLHEVPSDGANAYQKLMTLGNGYFAPVLGQRMYTGYANGGVIDELIFGVGAQTGRGYTFGERGPEMITPLGFARGLNGVTLNDPRERAYAAALGLNPADVTPAQASAIAGVLGLLPASEADSPSVLPRLPSGSGFSSGTTTTTLAAAAALTQNSVPIYPGSPLGELKAAAGELRSVGKSGDPLARAGSSLADAARTLETTGPRLAPAIGSSITDAMSALSDSLTASLAASQAALIAGMNTSPQSIQAALAAQAGAANFGFHPTIGTNPLGDSASGRNVTPGDPNGGRMFNPYFTMAGNLANPRNPLAFASGGILSEPVLGFGAYSGRTYTFAERGPERISPMGADSGGTVINMHAGSVVIPASDLEEMRSVQDFFGRIVQTARARGA